MTPGQLAVIAAQIAAARSTSAALLTQAAAGLEPTDYEVTLAYECVLDAGQHERFRAVRDAASNVVAAHTLEG